MSIEHQFEAAKKLNASIAAGAFQRAFNPAVAVLDIILERDTLRARVYDLEIKLMIAERDRDESRALGRCA